MSTKGNAPTPGATGSEARGASAGDRPANHSIGSFVDAIRMTGMGSPDIIADGDIHRFRDERDRPGTRNGWYVLHTDGIPAGAFGSWKTGEHHTWCIRETLTPAERESMRIFGWKPLGLGITRRS